MKKIKIFSNICVMDLRRWKAANVYNECSQIWLIIASFGYSFTEHGYPSSVEIKSELLACHPIIDCLELLTIKKKESKKNFVAAYAVLEDTHYYHLKCEMSWHFDIFEYIAQLICHSRFVRAVHFEIVRWNMLECFRSNIYIYNIFENTLD